MRKVIVILTLLATVSCVVILGGKANKYEINIMDRQKSESATTENQKTGVSLNANTNVQKDVIMKDPKSNKFDTVRMEIDTTRIKKNGQ